MRVAGAQQPHQPVVLVGGEPLAGDREPAACSPQRVVASVAVAEGLVLHTTAALVERGVGELHDVERIGDLVGVGQHRVEHRPVRGGQIERRPLDLGPPGVVAGGEPAARLDTVAARHDVEELAAANVDDLGRPSLGAELADLGEQCLVEPERVDGADPVGVIDQLLADRDHCVHHGVPATAQIARHIGDRAAVAADLQRRPPSCPCRQRATSRGDLGVVVAPAAPTARAAPALLAHTNRVGRPNTGRSTSTTSRTP